MNMDFDDDYMDVLQNMEFMIVQIYRQNPDMTDFQVDKALEALLRGYQAEVKGRSAPPLKLSGLDEQVYQSVKSVCEMRLGRGESPSETEQTEPQTGILSRMINAVKGTHPEDEPETEMNPLEVEEIIACIKRLRQSLSMWTKERGRRGYLDFIAPFLP